MRRGEKKKILLSSLLAFLLHLRWKKEERKEKKTAITNEKRRDIYSGTKYKMNPIHNSDGISHRAAVSATANDDLLSHKYVECVVIDLQLACTGARSRALASVFANK